MKIHDLDIGKLTPNGRAFNPSIVDAYGAIRLFYRHERIHSYNTDIGVIDLDEQFRPMIRSNTKVDLIRFSSKVTTFDDPRAFFFQGELYLMYSNGMIYSHDQGDKWCAGICMANMKGMKINKQMVPKFGKNQNMATGNYTATESEKNWSPFDHNGNLMLVYTINPLIVANWNLPADHCIKISETQFDQSFWKYGSFLGGGTPLVKKGEEYVGFFHSFTDDPQRPGSRRYHMGFYAIGLEKGMWKVTRMSDKPILSAEWDDEKDLRAQSGWRPNCVYPCGFIERGDNVIISYGWQDCRCKLLECSWEEILDNVRTIGADATEDKPVAKAAAPRRVAIKETPKRAVGKAKVVPA